MAGRWNDTVSRGQVILGSAVDDFLRPDRVVVGADDRSAAITVGALYEGVRAQVIVTDPGDAASVMAVASKRQRSA